VSASTLTVHDAAAPLQPPPLQPRKREPVATVAFSVTEVPLAYPSLQSGPQAIPPGVLVTVPEPVPTFTTVSPNRRITGA
jgi:hypothetical protein